MPNKYILDTLQGVMDVFPMWEMPNDCILE